MNDNIIHEIIYTDAADLSSETIGFGQDEEMARRIFGWTTNTFMRDGFILIGNAKNPEFVEVVQRRGPTVCFVELRSRPDFDMANILEAIHLAALDVLQPRYLATGLLQAQVVKAEALWENAKHIAIETKPNGLVLKHALLGDRQEAMKAFAGLVREGDKRVQRCVDAPDKYAVFDGSGITTWEFQERPQK